MSLSTIRKQEPALMLSAGISQASSTLNNIQTLRHQTSECLEYMQENKKQEFLFYEDILNDTIHCTLFSSHSLSAQPRLPRYCYPTDFFIRYPRIYREKF